MSTDSKARPVRILFAVSASAAVVAGGLPQLTPDPYDWVGAAIGLAGLTIAAGVTKWTEGRVTPTEAVAARVIETASGPRTVAGPAAPQRDGTTVKVEQDLARGPAYGEPYNQPTPPPGD